MICPLARQFAPSQLGPKEENREESDSTIVKFKNYNNITNQDRVP